MTVDDSDGDLPTMTIDLRCLTIACLLAGVACASSARAQPLHATSLESEAPDLAGLSDEDFSGSFCASGSLDDAGNDRPGQFAFANIVGDGSNPALGFFEDGTYAYFRLRLGGTPVLKPWNCPGQPDDYLESYSFSVRLDADHDASTYEAAVVVSDAGIELWANPEVDPDKERDDPSDEPEVLVFGLAASTLCTHLDVRLAGSHVGSGSESGSEDWFLTVAVALVDLHAVVDQARPGNEPEPLTGAFSLWGSAGDTHTGFPGDHTCYNDNVSSDPLGLSTSVSDPVVVGTFVELDRFDGPVNAGTPTITGTTEVGNTVTLTILDSTDEAVETVELSEDGSGNLSYTLTVNLQDGEHYRVRALGTDGDMPANVAHDEIDLLIDRSPPAVAITTPEDDTIVRVEDMEISGSVLDVSVAEVRVTVRDAGSDALVDSALATISGSTWSLPITGLSNHETYSIEVVATDEIDFSDTAQATFEVRTTIDALEITTPGDGQTIGDATPRVRGHGEPLASVEISVGDANYGPAVVDRSGSWSLTVDDALAQGTHSIEATQTLESDVSEFAVEITVDTSVALSITAPTENARIASLYPEFVGQSDSNAMLTLWLDDVSLGATAADEEGEFRFKILRRVEPGIHVLKVQAHDPVGNIRTLERSFKVVDPDADADRDGLSDREEDLDGDGDPENDDSDGDGTPNYLDDDDDNDGIPTSAGVNDDTDGDGILDYLDPDDDDDGIPTLDELDHPKSDMDGDGIPDYLDPDDDGDGIPTRLEADGRNDSDDDGLMDYLDPDDDGDGIPTALEGKVDSDEDGIMDYLDRDDDGDGVATADERAVDADRDGIPDHLDDEVTVRGKVDAGPDSGAGDVVADAGLGDAGTTTVVTVSGGCSVSDGQTNGGSAFAWTAIALWLVRRTRRGRTSAHSPH